MVQHTVVLAPHPDDETLRLSGFVLHCRERGDLLTLIAATDGGASNAARKLGWSREQEQEYRRAEQAGAWSALTGGRGRIVRLGLLDGQLGAGEVHEALMGLDVSEIVVAAHPEDLHPDHIACVEAARATGMRVRYSFDPLARAGSVYAVPPGLEHAAELAHRLYAGFGHKSVKTLFRAHRAVRYSARLTA